MKEEIFDVVVIGCGASGMMAAIRAGERGLKAIVLEKKIASWHKAFNYRKRQRESYKQRFNKRVYRLFS
jgi:flavin-dependent dehydrogenase